MPSGPPTTLVAAYRPGQPKKCSDARGGKQHGGANRDRTGNNALVEGQNEDEEGQGGHEHERKEEIDLPALSRGCDPGFHHERSIHGGVGAHGTSTGRITPGA